MSDAVALSAASVRRDLARTRRAHSDKTFWEVFQDAYVALFAVVLISSMAISALVDISGQLSSCSRGVCDITRGPMPLIVLVLVAGATVRGLSVLGPVVASRAAASWLLATPGSRGTFLRRPFAIAVLAAAGSGAAFLGAAALVAGTDAAGVAAGAGLGAAVGVLAGAAATVAQPHPRLRRAVVGCADLLLVVGVVGLAMVAFGRSLGDSSWLDSGATPVLAAGLLVVALALLVVAARRLVRLGLPEIVSGGELLAGLAGAAYGLDLALIGEIVASRRFRLLGARPSRRGRLTGEAALVERELLRLSRSPGRFVVYVALAVVPVLMDRAGLAPVAPMAAGLAGYAAVRWSASGLRRVWRSTGLRRALPYSVPVLLTCLTAPVGVLALLWSGAVAFALEPPWGVATLAVALSVYGGVVRAAAAPRPNYSGPTVTSPMGAVPPGLFTLLVRGPDIALLGTIAAAAGAPASITVGVPLLLAAIAVAMAISAATPKADLPTRQEDGTMGS